MFLPSLEIDGNGGTRVTIFLFSLFTVLCLAEELFTCIETSPLPVKGSKIQSYLGAKGL
jgi:hypothetical protein